MCEVACQYYEDKKPWEGYDEDLRVRIVEHLDDLMNRFVNDHFDNEPNGGEDFHRWFWVRLDDTDQDVLSTALHVLAEMGRDAVLARQKPHQ